MRCPACQAETTAEAKFCSSCGHALTGDPSRSGAAYRSASAAAQASGNSPRSNPPGIVAPSKPSHAGPLSSIVVSSRSAVHSGFGGAGSLSGPSSVPRFEPGTLIADRYRIVGQLGRGGMGEVYRADDLKLGQPVALKFLPEHLTYSSGSLERLFNEVRVARSVTHPAVCRVHDVAEIDGIHFLSMEYVDGEDLATLLRRIGRIQPDKALQIARQLCTGLHAAHEKGVLHRDLKPANVMIDGRGAVRITDFGLAGMASEQRAKVGRAGTPAYMAPEQFAGIAVTTKSDIFSLGLVLFEIFSGKPVYRPESEADLRRLHELPPPRLSSAVPDIDPRIEYAVLHCLQRDPAHRPASPLEVAAELTSPPTPGRAAVDTAPAGSLRPMSALAWIAALAAGLALVAALHARSKLLSRTPMDLSRDELRFAARQLADRLKLGPVRDSAIGFAWADDRTPGSTPIQFWYRADASPLAVTGFERQVRPDHPPVRPGESLIVLDPRARLIELHAPARTLDAAESEPAPPADWTWLQQAAGLASPLRESIPTHLPPAFSDQRAAFEGPQADDPAHHIRVEAAALHGRPVYAHAELRHSEPPRAPARRLSDHQAAEGTRVALAVALYVVPLALTINHVRRGVLERRGAQRFAAAAFALVFLHRALGAHLTLDSEIILGGLAAWFADALRSAFIAWCVYGAAEPLVRTSNRAVNASFAALLAGRWRDPAVGKDLLIGATLGTIAPAALAVGSLLAVRLGLGPPFADRTDLSTLAGLRQAVSALLEAGVLALLLAPALLAAFALMTRVIRFRPGAIALHALVLSVIASLWLAWNAADPRSLALPAAGIVIGSLAAALGARGTVLMLAAATFSACVLATFPIAMNIPPWMAPALLVGLAAVLGTAFYGAVVALGVRKASTPNLIESA